jgi:hypothetical protein
MTWLVRLYPRAWRERYGEEYAALLEEQPLTLLLAMDIARGAVDACLHPQWNGGHGPIVVDRMRALLLTVFCSYIAFVVAGFGFQKMTEDAEYKAAAHSSLLVGLPLNLIVAGAAVALLAVVIGGLPITYRILRQGLAGRRWDLLLYLVTPVAAFLVFVGFTLLLARVVARPAALPLVGLRRFGLFGAWVGVFLVCAAASTAAACLAVLRSEIKLRLYRFVFGPASATVVAMAVISLAVAAWGIGLRAAAPALFAGNGGILATSTAWSWVGIMIVMAASTAVAAWALLRGLREGSAPAEPA